MPRLSLLSGPMEKRSDLISAVGKAGTRLLPKLMQAGTKGAGGAGPLSRAGKWLANLGRRTLYSTTGWLPQMPAGEVAKLEKLRSIGFGSELLPKSERLAKSQLAKEYAGKWFKPGRLIRGKEKAQQAWVTRELARRTAERASLVKGYGSLPGVVKGMVKNPGDVLKTTWKSAGPGEKLMAAGFTGIGVHDVVKKPEPGGESRGAAMGRLAASTGLWFPLRSMSMIPQVASWMGSEALGGKAGGGISRLVRGPAPTPPPMVPPPVMKPPIAPNLR